MSGRRHRRRSSSTALARTDEPIEVDAEVVDDKPRAKHRVPATSARARIIAAELERREQRRDTGVGAFLGALVGGAIGVALTPPALSTDERIKRALLELEEAKKKIRLSRAGYYLDMATERHVDNAIALLKGSR